MKLIIAGGRDFKDRELMLKSIRQFTSQHGPIQEVVSGEADGADVMGAKIARAHSIKVEPFVPDWKDMSEPCVVKRNQYGEYNALAGMKRNKKMGNYADALLAFWDGKSTGTKDMIDYMRKLGKPVHVVMYNQPIQTLGFIHRTGIKR
jgi:hypothetical protein